jgi:hypothetical protein
MKTKSTIKIALLGSFAAFLVALSAGCAESGNGSDTGAPGTVHSLKSRTLPNSSCKSDADCKLIDNYCGGCHCLALQANEQPPQCPGREVKCFVAPCMNKVAACSGGRCAAVTR